MNFLDSYPVRCPYCGEQFEITIDASAGNQSYIEDCQVCCRPMMVILAVNGENVSLQLGRQDD